MRKTTVPMIATALLATTVGSAPAAGGNDLSVDDVVGIYQQQSPTNNWHTGVVQRAEARVVWTNANGANWNLQPDLANDRLLVGPDCPYYQPGGEIGFEFTTGVGPDGPTVLGFDFNNEFYGLASRGSTLQFVLDGEVPTLSPHYVAAARSWFTARAEYEAGAYEDALATLSALWDQYPVGNGIWWSIFGNDPFGLNLGTPPCYYGLRQLTDMTEWRVANPDHPGSDRILRLSVLAVGQSRGVEPRTMQELIDGEGVAVTHAFDERVLADDYAIVHESLDFFAEYVHTITDGLLEVEIQVIPLPELEVAVTASANANGAYYATIANYTQPFGSVSEQQIAATDWWWVLYPSHVPDQYEDFQYLPFIAGGMGVGPNGSPCFISDERWLARKPGHLGVGTYVPDERTTYLPQWLQHEVFHHFYRVWSGFGLEDQSHQWFDRSTWPADFVGQFEPDYYHESLFKRLKGATEPTFVAGLRNAILDASFDELEVADVLGMYERIPGQNGYHFGEIQPDGAQLEWLNSAGVSWGLDPRIQEGVLGIGPDCPYYNPDVPNDFQLALEENDLGDLLGSLKGFFFNGELYTLEKPCDGDLNGDGVVDGIDLSSVLAYWGLANAASDLDGDGTVNGTDLTILLANWGTCPGNRSGRARSNADQRGAGTPVHRGRPTPRRPLGTLIGCSCTPPRGARQVGCTQHTGLNLLRDASARAPREP